MGKAKTVNDSDYESNEEDVNSEYELSDGSDKEDSHSASESSDKDNEEDDTNSKPKKKAKEHMTQLQRLPEKDPEFYQFLKDNAKELLDFNDDGIEEDADTDMEESELPADEETEDKGEKPPQKVLTNAMVDSWCDSIRENGRLGAVRSLMKAFRTACHYGDDTGDDSGDKFSVMSSNVFNKIMLFVLNEMDGILRKLFKLPTSGGKKETIQDLMTTKQWTSYNHLVKSYLGNALHVLNQMTDTEMISFTIRRLKYSSIFLAAFPSLLRKYIKVVLHFWGTGGGALPVVSFLFLRDVCIRIGSDCIDECFKGIYKAYVLNCQFVNAVKLQHIQFLGNCVIELIGVDLPTAYQHAFVFIRQLGMILREAITMKTKEAFRKVYEWKFMNCLELWTGAICAYGSEPDFRPLAYPLSQIIAGVARLVPTARYFPLRLRCARMLNRIAAATDTFTPVSMLLLDMLEMKELNKPPTGGVGKAVDLRTVLKVNKATLKTRSFQEACVFSVVEEVAEHLAQWSYSVAFFELSFIPGVRLRSFCKATKVDRFRKEIRQLIRQIEANLEFTNGKRMSVSFLPNDPAAASFLEDEKKAGISPLSQHIAILKQRAQQRTDSLVESSLIVGEHSSIFGKKKIAESDEEDDYDDEDDNKDEQGATIFSSSWLPGSDSNAKQSEELEKEKKKKKSKKRKLEQQERQAVDEDVVEDLVISSDEDEADAANDVISDDETAKPSSKQPMVNKRNPRKSKRRGKPRPYNPKRRKGGKGKVISSQS